MRSPLLDKIDREAIDGDLSRALRLCLKLGGVTGSEELREWASLELDGYRGEEELPNYRKFHAPLLIDGISGACLTQQLNEKGNQGWELLGLHSFDLLGGITGSSKGDITLTLWKREVSS